MTFTLPLPLLPLAAGKRPPAPLTRQQRTSSAKSPALEIRTAGTSTWSFMTSLLSTGPSPYASDAPSSLPAERAPCAVASAKALLLDQSSGAAWCGDNAASPGLPTSRTLHDLLTPPAIANSAGYSNRVPAAPQQNLRRRPSHHDRTLAAFDLRLFRSPPGGGAPPMGQVTNVKRSRLDPCLHHPRRPLSCSRQHANVLRRSRFARTGAERKPL